MFHTFASSLNLTFFFASTNSKVVGQCTCQKQTHHTFLWIMISQNLIQYWLNYWHILISKDTSSFMSNTLLIRIQYCYQFKYFADLIKVMRRMAKWNMKMKYVIRNETGGVWDKSIKIFYQMQPSLHWQKYSNHFNFLSRT